MLAGQLGVREDVTEHRRHVGVEGHSPAKRVGYGWSARHRKAVQRAGMAGAVECSHRRAGGGSAPYLARPHVELEDLVGWAQPCRLR